jgi:hypothetical protein
MSIGHPSTGAGGGNPACDLALATRLVVSMATAYGLDSSMGLTWTGLPAADDLRRVLASDGRLRRRVAHVLADAYQQALALVQRRQRDVLLLAEALLVKPVLSSAEVIQIVGNLTRERLQ